MAAAEGEKKMTSFIAKSSGAEEFEAGAIRRAIEDDCDDDDSGILPPDVLSGEGLDNRDAGFPVKPPPLPPPHSCPSPRIRRDSDSLSHPKFVPPFSKGFTDLAGIVAVRFT
jgi:hypothetical protein